MKTLLLALAILLASVRWLGVSAYDVEDFSDGAMSDTVQHFDGLPY